MTRAAILCEINPDTLVCGRCGRKAARLPTYRHCVTIGEMAQHLAEEKARRRIRLPEVPLGGVVRVALGSIGITSSRLERATGRPCGCKQREAVLDKIGRAAAAGLERALNAAANFVAPSPVTDEDVAAVAQSLRKTYTKS